MKAFHQSRAVLCAFSLWLLADPAFADMLPPTPPRHRDVVCTEQYLPVCGEKGKVRKIYPNECFARADDAEVVARGDCDSKDPIKPQ